ncbi:translationally-controlled tumor protein homolog [Cheilinus undulatus]|uniref:translationally-controlled tumor protein homolog n=1 Tax=Cheilinus undulatus TaxID=241271 RepID=UPI001BD4A456|nr:translationally-controlled tumor protein homolog [Cheilinus undulatus]
MLIYKCKFCDDEMFSDIYKITVTRSGLFYEVEGKTITRTDQFDDALIGANASAEEACEGIDASSISGCDIVLNHNLRETGFTKKSFMVFIKEYCKKLKAWLEVNDPDRVEAFQEGCKKEVKKIVDDYDNLQFFTGESMNPEGMVGLLNYREDGTTPFMIFFKDGLIEEKC